MNPFCLACGQLYVDCEHVIYESLACELCGSTVGVCGYCFRCAEHESVYSRCQDEDWRRVEVVLVEWDENSC